MSRFWNSLPRKSLATLIALALLVVVGITTFWPRSAEKAFRWFGQLGFPDVAGRKYVRVATGQWFQSGNQPPENRYLEGFLLGESNGVFTVFTRDLFVQTFTRSAPGAAPHERIDFQVIDLPKAAKAYLRTLRDPPKDVWRRFGQRLAEPAETFVLAWACEQNGHRGLARQLFVEAASPRQTPQRQPNLWERMLEYGKGLFKRPPKRPDIIEQLQRDIGHAMMWRAVVAFSNPSVSRRDLLRQFESVVKNYPKCEYILRARETIATLEKMIREDDAHSTKKLQNEALTEEDHIAELIFDLRNQNGHQWSQPGWCDVFQTADGNTNTSAHELVRIGYPAVPQLIAVLDDNRFSRSVGYHRDFYFSHQVLTVGDCALAVLQRISGQGFYAPVTTSGYMSKDSKAQSVKEQALEWWKAFGAKGEKQMLIESVVAGGNDAPTQARRLLERFPRDATNAIVRGARTSTSEWTRTQLVELAAQLEGDGSTEFLREEMQAGPVLKARVAAAFGLRGKGCREAIPAMIQEWERFSEINGFMEGAELIQFLAGSDSEDAITALTRNVTDRSVNTRMEIVEALGEGRGPFREGNEPQSTNTLAAVEKGLVSALADTEETNMSGSRDGKSFAHPPICDLAGHFLAKRWPDRYAFDLSGSLKVRERQRIECQNVWRRMHGMDPLPMPKPVSVHVSAQNALQVTAIEWEENSAKPGSSFAAKVIALKDKHLKAASFVQLLTTFAKGSDSSGLSLKAIKDEDLTGVRIVIGVIPGASPRQNGWNVSQLVTVGNEIAHGSSGGGSFEHFGKGESWEDLEEAVTKALKAPAQTPFVIRVRITPSN